MLKMRSKARQDCCSEGALQGFRCVRGRVGHNRQRLDLVHRTKPPVIEIGQSKLRACARSRLSSNLTPPRRNPVAVHLPGRAENKDRRSRARDLMSSLSAGRVSLGGRRNSTAPPGNNISRNIADSMAEPASMFRNHDGSAPQADTAHPARATNTAIPHRRSNGFADELRNQNRNELRKDFNLHLLRPDVVGNVLRGYRQFVGSGTICSGMTNCPALAFARASQLSETGKAPSSRATSVRVLCEALALRLTVWPAMKSPAVKLNPDHRWLAGNDEGLGLAVGVARRGRARPGAQCRCHPAYRREPESASAKHLLPTNNAASAPVRNGNSAVTEVMDSSVFTRSTGSPGRITRGRSKARGTARNDV